MKINVITLHKNFKNTFLSFSRLIENFVENKKIELNVINPFKFSKNIDDKGYAGTGMVFKYEVLEKILIDYPAKIIVNLSPDGVQFTQKIAEKLLEYDSITFISSRYEGIDERIIDRYVTHSISLGDFIMSNGDLGLMIILDVIFRIKGMVKCKSLVRETFDKWGLDIPCYTRPKEINGMKVPHEYYSGNHLKFDEWKLRYSFLKTLLFRPDLFDKTSYNSKFKKNSKVFLEDLLKKIKEYMKDE